MDKDLLRKCQLMSPFEVKDILNSVAHKSYSEFSSQGKKCKYINVGRGNPNFLNTVVREAFAILQLFAVGLADSLSEKENIGFRPSKSGIAKKLGDFLEKTFQSEAKHFLEAAIYFAIEEFSFDADDFVFKLTDAALGDYYPVPPRVFPMVADVVRAYLAQALQLSDGVKDQKFELFCTEGASAAMVYIFKSLRINKLLNPGDCIAILTPVFSPYIEMPLLSDFGLKEIFIETSEELEWQLPLSELNKLEDPKVKALFMVHPTNPTSVSLTAESIERLGELVKNKRKDLIILTDTVYSPFVKDFHCILNEVLGNVICVHSYSKYFGVTGWRLGVIMLHENNIFDEYISSLSKADKDSLRERYSSVHPFPDLFKFIDRLEADSRDEALAHTGGLACPQQALMALFSIFFLMDCEGCGKWGDRKITYKEDVHRILKHRMDLLTREIGVSSLCDRNNAYYYILVNVLTLAKQFHGEVFATYLEERLDPIEFVYKLAQDTCTVCLPGGGFRGPLWTIRISLANADDGDYVEVGRNIKKTIQSIYDKWMSIKQISS